MISGFYPSLLVKILIFFFQKIISVNKSVALVIENVIANTSAHIIFWMQ